MKIIFSILGVLISFSSVFGNMPNVCENCQNVPTVNYEYDDVFDRDDIYEYDDDNEEEIDQTYHENVSTGSDSHTSYSYLNQTQYYQTYYFSRLVKNRGVNSKGSCGFVATGMLLSYWDTYWNDGIIPEIYEENQPIPNNYIEVDNLLSKSPGIKQEPESITNSSNEDYYNNISDNGKTYFQFKLMDLFQQNIRPFKYDAEKGGHSYGLTHNDCKQFYQYYFWDYLGLDASECTIGGSNSSDSSKNRQNVIDLVKQGIPVLLGVSTTNNTEKGGKGGHYVIAYDYDANTDELYCNFGEKLGGTHDTIEDHDYEIYDDYIYVKLNSAHVHSNNYFYTDSTGEKVSKCPCNVVIPHSVRCVGDYALDVCPTFAWGTLVTEKWFNIYHEFSILDRDRHAIFTKQVRGNQYTLTTEEWKQTIELTGTDFYVYIGIGSDVEPYWDDFYCSKLFKEPTEYAKKVQVKPHEWGFEERYWFSNEGIRDTSLTKKDLTVNTRRLRCGYIKDSYVVLSPRRENAGEAFLEMNFDKPVYAFMYSVCLWSKYEKLDGTAVIFVKNANGDWVQKVDFLNDIKLKIRGQGLDRYVLQCPEGTYGIRIYCTATAEGTTNSGRLCFDDLVFCTNPNDTQFITLTYPKTTKPTTT